MKIDWGALFRLLAVAFPKAAADFRANQPRAPGAPLSGPQIAVAAARFQDILTRAAPVLTAHPGAITAADDILDALDAGGFDWAATLETGVDALPGGVDMLRQWLPTVLWALTAFQPAATGIVGDGHDPMSAPSLPP